MNVFVARARVKNVINFAALHEGRRPAQKCVSGMTGGNLYFGFLLDISDLHLP